jgi:ATP-dependent RNA helicase RhlB
MTQKQTNNSLSDLEFSQLDLGENIRKGLQVAKFVHCTPIQALTLPVALKGADVAGQAQTARARPRLFSWFSFSIAAKPRMADRRHRALVSTRNSYSNTRCSIARAETGLKLGLAYGVDYEKQRQTLEEGVDILIGTPGRIIDFFKQHVFKLNLIEVMVLDEADRMFDLGFIDDIRYVLRRLPPRERRQCLLFSATLSHRVLELAYEHMNEPELLKVESERVTSEHVRQTVYYPANEEKPRLLAGLLKQFHGGRIIVFTNTRAATDRVERTLNANGFHVAAISGNVPQKTRQNLLRKFHDGEVPILVATDVAARGLHIPDVTHVINYDATGCAHYVHRIGRTLRYAKGEAISFACVSYAFHLPEIESFIGYPIPSEQMSAELLPVILNHRPAMGPKLAAMEKQDEH